MKAIFVKDVIVDDPDTEQEIAVSIYKDPESGAMFGIDSSYPDDVVTVPYGHYTITLPD